jgi:hypothetical protein
VSPKKLKQKRNKLPGKRFGPPPLRGPNPQGIFIDKKETDPDFQNKLAYLAGVFDGEGSFGYWSKGYKK